MSFNGSGTFVINSTGQPVVTGTVISSTAFNALTADLATGLSTTMTKDGQTTATANIPMGTFKFTGLGVGSAATDSANISQVQSSFGSFLTVSGTDTITATVSPSLTAYAAGQMFAFVAANTNTGAVTINISSLGAKSITKTGTTALVAGDLTANYLYVVVYDGTQFQVVGVSATSFTNLTVSGVLTLSGAGTQLVSTGTGAWQPPAGTTAQRPATPSPGAQRWNSTLLVYEIYNGFIWQPVVTQDYSLNYIVEAGGGGGGSANSGGAGGGGAGGFLSSSTTVVAGTSYTVTVGAGGAAGATRPSNGTNGSNSVFSSFTATGGGGGAGANTSSAPANSGGCGGGGGYVSGAPGSGTSGQGFAGGAASGGGSASGGGGGGTSAVGGTGTATPTAGVGGAGTASSITGSSVTYGGGGGGGNSTSPAAAGGAGGGGAGQASGVSAAVAGTANRGGGGGGGYGAGDGAAGGSGIVIVSYLSLTQRGSGGTVTSYGSGSSLTWVHSFTSSGTFTA